MRGRFNLKRIKTRTCIKNENGWPAQSDAIAVESRPPAVMTPTLKASRFKLNPLPSDSGIQSMLAGRTDQPARLFPFSEGRW
jgi:hypothetical protein